MAARASRGGTACLALVGIALAMPQRLRADAAGPTLSPAGASANEPALKWRKRGAPKTAEPATQPARIAREAGKPSTNAQEEIKWGRATVRAAQQVATAKPDIALVQATTPRILNPAGIETVPAVRERSALVRRTQPGAAAEAQPETTREPEPVVVDPPAVEQPPPSDRKLTPEEQCAEDERQRQQMLMGKTNEKGERQAGELEYCESAVAELQKKRAADITVDIAPPQPTATENECDRDWKDMAGRFMFRGRPHQYDPVSGNATFKLVNGETRNVPFDELSKEEQGHFLAMYKLPVECELAQENFTPRSWACSTFAWKATAFCHKPIYFEDVQLERYGHSHGPIWQPIVSAGRFFGTFPVLPYAMGVHPPSECLYTLGYYRPNSCAPWLLDPIPISARGALWEAGAWAAGVAIVP